MRSNIKLLYFILTIFSATPLSAGETQCSFPPTVDGEKWDVFWAQHHVGSDMLRKDIEKSNIDASDLSDIIGIWDTPQNNHGEHVSSIIAGPYPSAVIPTEHRLNYVGTNHFWVRPLDYATSYIIKCHFKKHCPSYINFSMKLRSNIPILPTPLFNGSKNLLIASVGNNASQIYRTQQQPVKKGKSILVASLAPDGLPSKFTSYGESVTIAAPADYSIRSYDFSGNKIRFGGSSGATPLVTGTLGGFTLLSGYSPNTREVKKILQKTAIPLPFLPSFSLVGAGMLNSYKIGRVAVRLKEQCQSDKQCLASLLKTEELYDFESESSELFKKSIIHFSSCNPTPKSVKTESCRRVRAFNDIRRAAFLNPYQPTIWKSLTCIKNKYFRTSSIYHRRLSERSSKTDDDILEEICQSKKSPLNKYLSLSSVASLWEKNDCSPDVLLQTLNNIFKSAPQQKTPYWLPALSSANIKQLSLTVQLIVRDLNVSYWESYLLGEITNPEISDDKKLFLLEHAILKNPHLSSGIPPKEKKWLRKLLRQRREESGY